MTTPDRRIGETLWHLATALGMERVTSWLQITESELREVYGARKRLSEENAQRVIDLGFIYDSLTLDYMPSVAVSWLEGNNSHLGGAKPLGAVWWGKTDEVYVAVLAQRAGAYA